MNTEERGWRGGRASSTQQRAGQRRWAEHVPVRGFNEKEVEDFLARAYEKEVMAARSQAEDKPLVYKSDKGWSTPKNSGVWGSRGREANLGGMNFLNQLRRAVAGGGGGGGGGGKE